MKKEKYLTLTMQQFIFLIYLIITTTIFLISLNTGNEGVSIRIFGGGDDGYFYWKQAQNIADGNEWIRTSIYPLIIGYLIKITGIKSVYVIRIFNYCGFILLVLFSRCLIKIQYLENNKSLNYKYNYKSVILLLLIFLLYPSLQMNVNLSIYRDIWIYTLYLLSLILSIKLLFCKKNKLLNFSFLSIILWLLSEFRHYALLSFILSILVYFIKKKLNKSNKSILLVFILIGVFIIYYNYFIDLKIPIVNMSFTDVLKYRNRGLYKNPGGSQMFINLEQPNFLLFVLNYIYSYIGNLLAPLPWHIKNLSTLFVFFTETIPMFFILIFLWKTRKTMSHIQKYILLHSFVWISLIAVSNDNIGTATRLRALAYLMILNVFVVNYVKHKYKRKLNKEIH